MKRNHVPGLRDVRSEQISSDDEPLVRSAVDRDVGTRVIDATSGISSDPRIVSSSLRNNRFVELVDESEVATTIPALPQGMVEHAPSTIEDQVVPRATFLDSSEFGDMNRVSYVVAVPNFEVATGDCSRVAVVAERGDRGAKRLRSSVGGSHESTVPVSVSVVDALEEDLSVPVPSTMPGSEGGHEEFFGWG